LNLAHQVVAQAALQALPAESGAMHTTLRQGRLFFDCWFKTRALITNTAGGLFRLMQQP